MPILLPLPGTLDLFGFDMYTFPRGEAGAIFFLGPLEAIETKNL